MRDRQRLALFLVACAGALITHAIAYLVVAGGFFAGDAHGHLGLVTALVMPVGAVAFARMAITAARRVDLGAVVSVRHLVAAQAAIFLVQEGIELLSAGGTLTSAVGNPAIGLGLALQPIIAAGLVLSLRFAVRIVASLLALAPRDRARSALAGPPRPHPLTPVGAPLGAPKTRRGPPALFVIS